MIQTWTNSFKNSKFKEYITLQPLCHLQVHIMLMHQGNISHPIHYTHSLQSRSSILYMDLTTTLLYPLSPTQLVKHTQHLPPPSHYHHWVSFQVALEVPTPQSTPETHHKVWKYKLPLFYAHTNLHPKDRNPLYFYRFFKRVQEIFSYLLNTNTTHCSNGQSS
jgi:hypothetical protein